MRYLQFKKSKSATKVWQKMFEKMSEKPSQKWGAFGVKTKRFICESVVSMRYILCVVFQIQQLFWPWHRRQRCTNSPVLSSSGSFLAFNPRGSEHGSTAASSRRQNVQVLRIVRVHPVCMVIWVYRCPAGLLGALKRNTVQEVHVLVMKQGEQYFVKNMKRARKNKVGKLPFLHVWRKPLYDEWVAKASNNTTSSYGFKPNSTLTYELIQLFSEACPFLPYLWHKLTVGHISVSLSCLLSVGNVGRMSWSSSVCLNLHAWATNRCQCMFWVVESTTHLQHSVENLWPFCLSDSSPSLSWATGSCPCASRLLVRNYHGGMAVFALQFPPFTCKCEALCVATSERVNSSLHSQCVKTCSFDGGGSRVARKCCFIFAQNTRLIPKVLDVHHVRLRVPTKSGMTRESIDINLRTTMWAAHPNKNNVANNCVVSPQDSRQRRKFCGYKNATHGRQQPHRGEWRRSMISLSSQSLFVTCAWEESGTCLSTLDPLNPPLSHSFAQHHIMRTWEVSSTCPRVQHSQDHLLGEVRVQVNELTTLKNTKKNETTSRCVWLCQTMSSPRRMRDSPCRNRTEIGFWVLYASMTCGRLEQRELQPARPEPPPHTHTHLGSTRCGDPALLRDSMS